jgi:hypothetical protein
MPNTRHWEYKRSMVTGKRPMPSAISIRKTVQGLYVLFCGLVCTSVSIYRMSKKPGTIGILFIIYYLYYMLYMFTPTLYAFSQPLYHVYVDFAQHIGIDSSTTVCNSLPKVTKISDFNSIHRCLQESPSTISTLSSNVNAIFSFLTFNFNL